jgi:hypothetical protein
MIKSRRMRWAEHVALMGEKDTGGKARKKRLAGKRRRTWVDNIKMDLIELELSGMDWIDLAQDRD